MRRVGFAPFAQFESHRQPHAAGDRDRLSYRAVFFQQMVCKFNNKDAVRECNSGKHDHTHQRHHIQGGSP